jgi:hypothetical protein
MDPVSLASVVWPKSLEVTVLPQEMKAQLEWRAEVEVRDAHASPIKCYGLPPPNLPIFYSPLRLRSANRPRDT